MIKQKIEKFPKGFFNKIRSNKIKPEQVEPDEPFEFSKEVLEGKVKVTLVKSNEKKN